MSVGGMVGYSDWQVYTFGNGDHGKLGHGDVRKVSVPTLVAGLVNMHVIKVRGDMKRNHQQSSEVDSFERVSINTIGRIFIMLFEHVCRSGFSGRKTKICLKVCSQPTILRKG